MLIRSGDTAHGGTLRGMCLSQGVAAFSRIHELAVVDRIGSGDSFAGALLFACSVQKKETDAIEFATSAAVWKHTVPGDWNRGSVAEIEALAGGAGGAFVRR
jgi:2-dehydro-3-deoxygluconokinase